MGKASRAVRVSAVGIVQGVGFRPFVFRLATTLGLRGYVRNMGGSEVEIWVEGEAERVEEFLKRLSLEKPPPSRIDEIRTTEESPRGYDSFVIMESSGSRVVRSMIPPDIAICNDCAEEVLGRGSRFSRYHWNSCAWCGPRFSMLFDVPYDRKNTAMTEFPLCEECERDYRDPQNERRFHAQGISCSLCGPRTLVLSSRGEKLTVADAISFAARALEEGKILAIKGVGGYHIAALASDDEVVRRLRERKRRPTKPFALMARDISVVSALVDLPPGARELLTSPQRPILLLPKKEGIPVSELVAPGLAELGIMLPYTGFQLLLLREVRDGFLIMTSANVHGRPMSTELTCVLRELEGLVDYIIEHERKVVHRVDDSVVRFTDGEPVLLRRGRGYAPAWIELPFSMPDGVAVGAELQTAGGVGFERRAVLTQYIGDVDEPGTLEELDREVRWFTKAYGLKPSFVARDMHPLYHNRAVAERLAKELGVEVVEVQHHHAHAAAAMIDVGLGAEERVVAVTIDGTGFGPGGSIWGGEVLLSSYEAFERVGSLRPFSLPGGDSAAYYPAKPLISLLASFGYPEEEVMALLERRSLLRSLPHGRKEAQITYELARRQKGVETSSLGRVLDAFAALLGVCAVRTFEGEPPMLLEAAARGGKMLDVEAEVRGGSWSTIDVKPLLDLAMNGGESLKDVAVTVQMSVGRAFGKVALAALKGRRGTRSDVVLISGGASVNTYIVRGIRESLSEGGVKALLPRGVPPNDGSIALGQLAVGCFSLGLC
ncbi:MAG: carbamoyltransferase HypF [Acidilobaceae archaeon]|nr:carbamoyltransferase HypF [Acidilobaceae archaeon]MDW7974703.1 carbamoyltransferase HypF [Sulfolobales archaeon]